MKNNPWNLPDGTKLVNKFGCEFVYCFSECYQEWMLYNPWNNSFYELDQPYFTERSMFNEAEV